MTSIDTDIGDTVGPTRPRHRAVRNLRGAASVETFLLTTIATILVTRGYLDLTNYPRVGSGTLHIAHALYGAAALVIALVMNWMFLSHSIVRRSILVGGVGFGLVLDEVGKFVTADNDYFYGPAAEIMFVTMLALLLISRTLHALNPLTAHEYLCNAAAIGARGLARGLSREDRAFALGILTRAEANNSASTPSAAVRAIIDAAPHIESRRWGPLIRLRSVLVSIVSPVWVPTLIGWALTLCATAGVTIGIVQLVLGGTEFDSNSTDITIDRMGPAAAILFVSAVLTLCIAAPATISRRRIQSRWPLIALRVATLIFTVLNALAHFATEGFAAVGGIAVGGAMLVALEQHLRRHRSGSNDDSVHEIRTSAGSAS